MSLVQFQEVLRFEDAGLEQPIRQRAEALADWLHSTAPREWDLLRQTWGLPDHRSARVRELWSFFLATTEVARNVARDPEVKAADFVASLASSPIDIAASLAVPGGGGIALPCDHPVIRADLRTVAHPLIAGTTLSGLPVSAIEREAGGSLRSALGLIEEACPELLGLVRFHCGAICLLQSDPPLEPGQCVSLTSKLIPGIVYVSPVPTILMAESIVHESAHLCLACHERRESLYIDPELRIMTPLRPDPRPISGLMHQVWVLLHLTRLYQDLLQGARGIVERNQSAVEKRLSLHSDGLSRGLETLGREVGALSPAGRDLLEAMFAAATSR